jgi:hypothetical protein
LRKKATPRRAAFRQKKKESLLAPGFYEETTSASSPACLPYKTSMADRAAGNGADNTAAIFNVIGQTV